MDNLNLKALVNIYFGLIFKVSLIIVIFASLFLFANLTTDIYETPKFIILLIFVSIMLLLLTLKFTLLNKVVFVRTPLDLPLLLLAVVAAISTFASASPYVALLGNQARIAGSLVALITYVLFYFILTNNLRSLKDVKFIVYLASFAGAILSVVTLISYAGIKILPPSFIQAQNFTPTGSSFSTVAFLTILLPLVVIQILSNTNLLFKLLNSLMLALFGITIALIGTWPIWIAAVLGLTLTFFLISPIRQISQIDFKNTKLLVSLAAFAASLIIVALVLTLSFIPPIGGAKNPLYDKYRAFPREIQLDFITSWKTSVSAFRDHPFYGSGPATFLFNFTNYKPIEFNSTKFWNIRFEAAFNEYLGILGTLGGIGLLALVSLTALFVSSAYSSVVKQTTGHELKKALAVSGIIFFVILALHSSTLPVWVIGLLVLAAFSVVNLLTSEAHALDYHHGGSIKQILMRVASLKGTEEETIKIEALPGILLVIAISLVGFAFFFGGKFVFSDYHHRLALNAVSKNQGVVAYNELIASEKLNPINDLYRTDLAQVNFALANAIALAKAPTEASPAGSLTDQDKQNIQVLLQQSINEARTSVTLSPRSSINWEILATLYRQIAGVAQNALLFSLDSYGRAIFQDPLNPNLRLNVGGTYYAIKNYDLAIRFFTDSINLKPDFANGYYNLSVALRDKGDLNAALQAAEKTLSLVVDTNSSDYKVASDYLTDLRNKISPPTPAQPPAATASGALQNQQLPKVVNVGNPPEKIATPEAIKRSPSPSPSPTP